MKTMTKPVTKRKKAAGKPAAAPKAKKAKPRPKAAKSAPVRVAVAPVERTLPPPVERPLSAEELMMERDRIYARLVGIPNVISRPSPADYVVFEVADPNVVHRKLIALGMSPDVVQKHPKIPNGMRVFVRSSKMNEAFLRALEAATK